MELKLIEDAIFPNCKSKTKHNVFEDNQYFYIVIENVYIVIYVNQQGEKIEVASYADRKEMFKYFR